MTVWLRSGVSKYKWHAERESQPWTTYCGRYISPDFEPGRVVSNDAPFDQHAVCLLCTRAVELHERNREKATP